MGRPLIPPRFSFAYFTTASADSRFSGIEMACPPSLLMRPIFTGSPLAAFPGNEPSGAPTLSDAEPSLLSSLLHQWFRRQSAGRAGDLL